jgi:hypothetical protein
MPPSTRIALTGIAVAALGVAACSPRVIDAVEVCCGNAGGADGGEAGAGAGGAGAGGDPAEAGLADAGAPLLLHWYKFEGLGTTAIDSAGGPEGAGTILNTQLAGTGYVELAGGAAGSPNPQYVDLPNFLLAGLESVTLEAWVSWNGGPDWQRIFDFGEDMTGIDIDAAARPVPDIGDRTRDGRSYVFLTAEADRIAFPNVMRATYLKPKLRSPTVTVWSLETAVTAPALPVGMVAQHVVVTIDGSNHLMTLFVNGVDSATPLNDPLSEIYDVNCWLGRSQFPIDPLFSGRIYEFRIYRVALTPSQVRANFMAGADGIPVQ